MPLAVNQVQHPDAGNIMAQAGVIETRRRQHHPQSATGNFSDAAIGILQRPKIPKIMF